MGSNRRRSQKAWPPSTRCWSPPPCQRQSHGRGPDQLTMQLTRDTTRFLLPNIRQIESFSQKVWGKDTNNSLKLKCSTVLSCINITAYSNLFNSKKRRTFHHFFLHLLKPTPPAVEASQIQIWDSPTLLSAPGGAESAPVEGGRFGSLSRYLILFAYTLPETNSSPLKIGRNPIGKACIPTIHF